MAKIDELLAQVVHDQLRVELAEAVADLRRNKKFGLVFEEHIPETTLLPAAGVREGSVVVLRRKPEEKTRYLVERFDGDEVTITDGEKSQTLPLADLLVVKPFGEPVYPVLKPIDTVKRNDDKPYHAVINGENFHALQLLLFAYKGQVDCIYIDPPYNTGARDWKYNNDYVDDNDVWRHSKWLSMMEKRLRLAKDLLKTDSVLIVTIDANEAHHLGVLLEDLFPLARRQMVSICINPSGTSGEGLSRVDEYAFFVFLGNARPSATVDDMLSDDLQEAKVSDRVAVEWESLLRRGNSWYRSERPNLCYPVYIDPDSGLITGTGAPFSGDDESKRETNNGNSEAAWPIRKDGKLGIWRVDAKRLQQLVQKGYAYAASRDGARGTWALKYLMTGTVSAIEQGDIVVTGQGDRGQVLLESMTRRGTTAKTLWKRGRHTAGGGGGTQLLAAQLGERNLFPFPKSVYSVQDCLDVAIGENDEALVLDFFAGSGTTLNAVALLNRRDESNRQCILVTNNEVDERVASRLHRQGVFVGDPEFDRYGICKAVTAPRIRAALTGIAPAGTPVPGEYLDGHAYSEGFDENVVFFDLVYSDPDRIEIGSQFDDIIPALWLAAGAIGDPNALKPESAWLLPEHIPLAVLLDEDNFRPFLTMLRKRPDVTHVWLVTDSEAAFARMREHIPGERFVGMLYRDYLRNFIVNAEVAR